MRKKVRNIGFSLFFITQNYINEIWESCFQSAVEDAIYEMKFSKLEKRNFQPDLLTQSEVFEEEYIFEEQT